MPLLTRTQLLTYALAGVLVVVLGVRFMHGQAAGGTAPAVDRGAPPPALRLASHAPTSALVHVAGAVRRPGVYRLREGQRIEDAVQRAGGARHGADLDAINLAAKVADGQQIVVPKRGAAGAVAATGAAAPGSASQGPISLNSATAEQLDTLDGIGPATAQKILAYRQQHGGFRSVDDLGEVSGIGPKKLAALRGKVQP